jgi:hypothetical protein
VRFTVTPDGIAVIGGGEPVRLLHHSQVPQPRRHVSFGAGPDPQILGQPEQHTARYECLVTVIAAEVERVPAAEGANQKKGFHVLVRPDFTFAL